MWFKLRIRKFARWLEWKTSTWILPTSAWRAIEDQCPAAVDNVDLAGKIWGQDEPEVLAARARISQLAWLKKNNGIGAAI